MCFCTKLHLLSFKNKMELNLLSCHHCNLYLSLFQGPPDFKWSHNNCANFTCSSIHHWMVKYVFAVDHGSMTGASCNKCWRSPTHQLLADYQTSLRIQNSAHQNIFQVVDDCLPVLGIQALKLVSPRYRFHSQRGYLTHPVCSACCPFLCRSWDFASSSLLLLPHKLRVLWEEPLVGGQLRLVPC